MAKLQFKFYSQAQGELFPSFLGEKIPETHHVRLLSGIVDALDITDLLETYKSFGCPAYHPRMLLKVVFYAYMNNIYSCRKIEDALKCHVHYMWLSGSQTPSFSTINRFRSEHMKDAVNRLFSQVVTLLVEMGQITLEEQYIDGTKIESVANKYTFVWKKTVEKNKAKLEEKIRNILSQIDEGIAQDNTPDADAMPDAIDSKTLARKIEELNEQNRQLSRETKEGKQAAKAKEKVARELKKHQEKLEEYEQHLETLGPRNSYSKTDPDATFMRMKEDAMNNGQTKPGYNVQIATENQYIVNMQMYWNPTDTTTLPDFLLHGKELTGIMPDDCIADSGYGSEENYEFMLQNDITAYVKYNWFHKEQHRPFRDDPFRQENLYYNKEEDYYVCPMGQHMTLVGVTRKVSGNGFASYSHRYRAQRCTGCPLRSRCYKSRAERRTIEVNHNLNEHKRKAREMLTSEEGMRHRSRRPIEPEAVFGQLKFDWHYRRFRHKGKDKVYMDFAILAMSHNLRKLMRNAQNELMEVMSFHFPCQRKPNRSHITLLGTNNHNFRFAA